MFSSGKEGAPEKQQTLCADCLGTSQECVSILISVFSVRCFDATPSQSKISEK